MHAALNYSMTCCSTRVITKLDGPKKEGNIINAPAQSAAFSTRTEITRNFKAKKRNKKKRKMQIET